MNINFEKVNEISTKKSLDLMSSGDSIFIVLEEYLDSINAPKDYSIEWNGGSGAIALLKNDTEVDNYNWCKVETINYKHRSVMFSTGDTIYFQ